MGLVLGLLEHPCRARFDIHYHNEQLCSHKTRNCQCWNHGNGFIEQLPRKENNKHRLANYHKRCSYYQRHKYHQ